MPCGAMANQIQEKKGKEVCDSTQDSSWHTLLDSCLGEMGHGSLQSSEPATILGIWYKQLLEMDSIHYSCLFVLVCIYQPTPSPSLTDISALYTFLHLPEIKPTMLGFPPQFQPSLVPKTSLCPLACSAKHTLWRGAEINHLLCDSADMFLEIMNQFKILQK